MLKTLATTLILGLPGTLIAGGPLVLEGSNGQVPATYANPEIIFNFETGALGPRDNDTADQLVRDALAIWNIIDTSTINITQGTDVPVDIDETNFTSYIPVPDSSTVHNDDDGLNPIVYDDDGGIIDEFFGIGQGTGPDATVVGFAASSILIGSCFFTEGFAVVNGNSDLRINDTDLTLIVAHEIGHYLGLDHSQTDIDNTELFIQRCPAFDDDDYPLMYPYACRSSQNTHADDNVALSTLYPTDDFFQQQGQLMGTFVTTEGVAVRGANLWVENIQTGEIYSIVSDYLKQFNGFFNLMLPPGSYILHANSINIEFFGGSSVGPYANTPFDVSFLPPASSIGADLVFNADGSVPEIINLEAGMSVEIVFRTDGSGSVTTSDTQIDLAQIYNSADACNATAGGGGGGTPSLPLLAALLCIPAYRLYTKHRI
ncbi:MAG: matrixin family metalloprotease [Thiotrichales bacterium]|nr:MAG: matrixin family metalloprotease [Thiotrichales bacterium]